MQLSVKESNFVMNVAQNLIKNVSKTSTKKHKVYYDRNGLRKASKTQ